MALIFCPFQTDGHGSQALKSEDVVRQRRGCCQGLSDQAAGPKVRCAGESAVLLRHRVADQTFSP